MATADKKKMIVLNNAREKEILDAVGKIESEATPESASARIVGHVFSDVFSEMDEMKQLGQAMYLGEISVYGVFKQIFNNEQHGSSSRQFSKGGRPYKHCRFGLGGERELIDLILPLSRRCRKKESASAEEVDCFEHELEMFSDMVQEIAAAYSRAVETLKKDGRLNPIQVLDGDELTEVLASELEEERIICAGAAELERRRLLLSDPEQRKEEAVCCDEYIEIVRQMWTHVDAYAGTYRFLAAVLGMMDESSFPNEAAVVMRMGRILKDLGNTWNIYLNGDPELDRIEKEGKYIHANYNLLREVDREIRDE